MPECKLDSHLHQIVTVALKTINVAELIRLLLVRANIVRDDQLHQVNTDEDGQYDGAYRAKHRVERAFAFVCDSGRVSENVEFGDALKLVLEFHL